MLNIKAISMEDWVDLIHANKPKDDLWKEDWVDSARDRVHNLDLNITEHEDIYKEHTKFYNV